MKKLTWQKELDTGKYRCIMCNRKFTSMDLVFSKHSSVMRKEVKCCVCGTIHIKIKNRLYKLYRNLDHPWNKIDENINKGLKLKHIKSCLNDIWYWECPICGKWLAPHNMKVHYGEDGGWRVLQAKGAASRHLMMHDRSLVQHGRKINDILKKPKIYNVIFNVRNKYDNKNGF
jgi:hypothetical protein